MSMTRAAHTIKKAVSAPLIGNGAEAAGPSAAIAGVAPRPRIKAADPSHRHRVVPIRIAQNLRPIRPDTARKSTAPTIATAAILEDRRVEVDCPTAGWNARPSS